MPDDNKQCPFCGWMKIRYALAGTSKYGQVECTNCSARGPEVFTNYKILDTVDWHAEALREWNNREAEER